MSRDAVVLAFLSLADLSYGDPQTRPEFVRRLAPWDTPADADDMCSSQSCCITAICAGLLIAEVDGSVRGFRGRLSVDPLRSPRVGHYDGPAYLETLAQQRGLLCRPTADRRPTIEAGTVVLIATGNDVHGIGVVGDPGPDGWTPTVEGGKFDPLSEQTGAKACTLIAHGRRRLRQAGRVWLFEDDDGDTRPVISWFQAGDLPTVRR